MAKPFPSEFHKFRTFGAQGENGKDKDTVFAILRGRLQFSFVRNFNDPFEGRPFSVPAFSDDMLQRSAIKRFLETRFSRVAGIPTAEGRDRVREYMLMKSTQEMTMDLGLTAREMFGGDDLLVFCVSTIEAVRAPLTWSHYADNHRGVCIHFDSTKKPFDLAYEVRYGEDYPKLIFPRSPDRFFNFSEGLLKKSSLLKHEHEYRILRQIGDDSDMHRTLSMQWEGNVGIANSDVVTGITFGVRLPEPLQKELMIWIEENAPTLKIWRATLHNSRYEIERNQIR